MMNKTTGTFAAAALQRLGELVLEAVGTPSDLARIVAESLVVANLAGHDSHGIMRLRSYTGFVRAGRIQPGARPSVESRAGATALLDGHWGWGQPAARFATETALALAREHGIGAASIHRCNHIGRLGEYVETMTRAGMMGIALCHGGPGVTPYGGRDRLLGTNPFAWAAPTMDPETPLVLDFATSAVAEGKLEVARIKGEAVAPGLIVDSQGRPTTSPDDYYAGGALLPFGGHKGSAMSIMVEFLAGALSGSTPSCLPEYDGSNGTLLIAVNVGAFRPLGGFVDEAKRFYDVVKRSRPAEGFSEVSLPGEPEAQARRQRRETGIPLPAQTRKELRDLAAQLGLHTPEIDGLSEL